MKEADPLAYMRNINTAPGPNAGRSIDPTKPGPDADRHEQPRDKTDEWDHEHAKSRVIVQDENGRFKAIDKRAPSPAPSPEQDVREALKEVLRKHEWDNGYINAKTLLIEHIVAALA